MQVCGSFRAWTIRAKVRIRGNCRGTPSSWARCSCLRCAASRPSADRGGSLSSGFLAQCGGGYASLTGRRSLGAGYSGQRVRPRAYIGTLPNRHRLQYFPWSPTAAAHANLAKEFTESGRSARMVRATVSRNRGKARHVLPCWADLLPNIHQLDGLVDENGLRSATQRWWSGCGLGG